MRHIANYGIEESQVKIVITFFVARKMGSVEPKSTLQEALFKAQKMTQGEMETPSCRATLGANAPERVRRNLNPRMFMTETQLKKLDDAVTPQRDIGTCNERVEALKADLIREARSTRKTSQSSKAAVCLRCTLESSLPSHDLSTGLFFGSL